MSASKHDDRSYPDPNRARHGAEKEYSEDAIEPWPMESLALAEMEALNRELQTGG